MKEELKIKTEIDLRSLNGNGFPGDTVEDDEGRATVEGIEYIAVPMNGDADINSNKAEIKKVFEILADKDNYPVLYHCNIGTNRTGIVAYLLNALCGVEEEDLYFDYMFSDFGTIALPTPLNANRSRTELVELTGTTGAAGRVKAYAGEKLVEKTENCLKDCGVSEETYTAVRNIMTGN